MTTLAQQITCALLTGGAAYKAAHPTPVQQPVPKVDHQAEADAYLSMVPGLVYLARLAGKSKAKVMDLGCWDRGKGLDGAARLVWLTLENAGIAVMIDYDTSGSHSSMDSITIQL